MGFSTQARPQSFIGRECNKPRMELLQCAPSNRAYKSEDRDVAAITMSSKTGRHSAARSATLSGGERRVSMPTGHHYASSTMGRTTAERKRTFYGSSLSLADEHGTHELTSRTLRPPSPTTLRKSSTTLPPSAAMIKTERSPNPCLPRMRVELESPKLADYLEKPRLVNAIQSKSASTVEVARGHHAKRYENGGASIPEYRNLRLGNFMENQAQNDEP